MTRRVDGVKLTPKMECLLDLLLEEGQPALTGFEVIRLLEMGSGSVYSMLDKLEGDHGWVTGEGEGEPGSRQYWLTPLGRRRALTLLGRYEELP